MKNKWNNRFLELASVISTWSKDPSTKVGAVITKDKFIVSTGYNGFARGVDDDIEKYNDRNLKYKMILHAEENAIINTKVDLYGCFIYVYPVPPCSLCAAKIIQSGIKKVISFNPNKDFQKRWINDVNIAKKMFKEACVELILYEK